jgi:hypothetical protein
MSKLSYEQIRDYSLCPRRHWATHVAKQAGAPTDAARQARAGDEVIAELLHEHIGLGASRALSRSRMQDLWAEAFARHGLDGRGRYEDGEAVLDGYIARAGTIDPRRVLGVAAAYELALGDHTVVGTLERVDRVSADCVEVRVHHWGHIVRDDRDADAAQRTELLALAARGLWPWAERVRICDEHLRTGGCVVRERTGSDLRARRRLELAVERIARDADAEAHVTPGCAVCPHRNGCGAYAADRNARAEAGIPDDLEDLVAAYARAADEHQRISARSHELGELVKVLLDERGELSDGETLVRLQDVARTRCPAADVLPILARATGRLESELLAELASIDTRALDRLVKNTKLGRDARAKLDAELADVAEVSFSSRLWVDSLERALSSSSA